MTPEELAEIKARADAASPGPWKCWDGWGPAEWDGLDRCSRIGPRWTGGLEADGEMRSSEADFEFAAHARTDIPKLLAEVERLQNHIDATRRMLRIECAEFDDNDWSDDLHLADVVEKHLARSARDEINRLRAALQMPPRLWAPMA